MKDNKLYLFVFKWPEDEIRLPDMRSSLQSARYLGINEQVAYTELPGTEMRASLVISPPSRPDPIATVIELTYAEEPKL